jgi:hypothetical protein
MQHKTLGEALLATMGWFTLSAAHAALNITPPQLAPDDQGVIATEVKSSLAAPTRWSVRVIPWDPGFTEPPAAAPSNVAAQGGPATLSTPSPHLTPPAPLAIPSHPLGVEISPRFFSLAGHGRQVIRARIMDRSRHYRLLIEQIPDDALSNQGVNFRFRFSLPIYRSRQDPLIPHGVTIH